MDDWRQRVRAAFARQGLMALLGAELTELEPGRVAVETTWRPELTQQDGYFHAGVSSALADAAGGFAALSRFPADAGVLSVEFKINLLAAARGDRLRAEGRVVKRGRTLTVCALSVSSRDREGNWTATATGLQTLICLPGKAIDSRGDRDSPPE